MRKPNRLPGRNISGQTIVDALSEYLDEEQQPSQIKKKVNETKDRVFVIVTFDGTEDEICLTLIKRVDGTVSISVADNALGSDAMAKAQTIRDALYDKLGFGKPQDPFFKRHMPITDYEAIESLLDSVSFLQQVSKKDNSEERFAQYLDNENEKLTIHFYKRRHTFLAQYGTKQMEGIVVDVLREATGFISIEEIHERIKQGEHIEQILKPTMINGLGEELYDFFKQENPAAFETLLSAYQDMAEKRQTSTKDYSSIIQSICRCYEALMKTLFGLIGLPEYKYVLDYMDWNKEGHIHRIKLEFMDMRMDIRYRLGFLYDEAYGKYRNDVSHGGPPDAHFVIHNYEKAESWFSKVSYSMKESYAILSKYTEQ